MFHAVDWCADILSGVLHKDIDVAPALDDGVNQHIDLLLPGNIRWYKERFMTERVDFRGQDLKSFSISSRESQVRTLLGQGQSRGATDPAGCAGDDGNLVEQHGFLHWTPRMRQISPYFTSFSWINI